MLHYETQQTGIDVGDTEPCLIGETTEGILIEGCDGVQVHCLDRAVSVAIGDDLVAPEVWGSTVTAHWEQAGPEY